MEGTSPIEKMVMEGFDPNTVGSKEPINLENSQSHSPHKKRGHASAVSEGTDFMKRVNAAENQAEKGELSLQQMDDERAFIEHTENEKVALATGTSAKDSGEFDEVDDDELDDALSALN